MIKSKDVVRIKTKKGYQATGVVNRVDGDNINVFVTQNNPYGLGVWFDLSEVKRIGKVK